MRKYRDPYFIFGGVLIQVDSATDFVDDEDAEDEKVQEQESRSDGDMPPALANPSKRRLTSKTTSAPENSLQVLDACLPKEPQEMNPGRVSGSETPKTVSGNQELPSWLRRALFEGLDRSETRTAAATSSPLTARLVPLAQRMRSLLRRGVYAKRRRVGTGDTCGWADGGRPAGFVGAGLAEELCLAVFGRIQALKAKGVGKQVRDFGKYYAIYVFLYAEDEM